MCVPIFTIEIINFIYCIHQTWVGSKHFLTNGKVYYIYQNHHPFIYFTILYKLGIISVKSHHAFSRTILKYLKNVIKYIHIERIHARKLNITSVWKEYHKSTEVILYMQTNRWWFHCTYCMPFSILFSYNLSYTQ